MPVIHDFRRGRWGHKCVHMGNGTVSTHSTPRIQEGDVGIFEAIGADATARRFVEVEHCSSPSDMAFAKLEIVPQDELDDLLDQHDRKPNVRKTDPEAEKS